MLANLYFVVLLIYQMKYISTVFFMDTEFPSSRGLQGNKNDGYLQLPRG